MSEPGGFTVGQTVCYTDCDDGGLIGVVIRNQSGDPYHVRVRWEDGTVRNVPPSALFSFERCRPVQDARHQAQTNRALAHVHKVSLMLRLIVRNAASIDRSKLREVIALDAGIAELQADDAAYRGRCAHDM